MQCTIISSNLTHDTGWIKRDTPYQSLIKNPARAEC
jgi:hypothetical protein